ncbi:MAG TPA: enoyl-CoA hydratase-related protein [Polyangiaceae bacterium]|nr:enoyl-CoA hydratase-related protein [Polyangiaceae bacterium]
MRRTSPIRADPEVGCIVVTGAERGFCAGGDVTAMNAPAAAPATFENRVDRQRAGHRLSGLLYAIPKVTLAAINGAAAGAGLGIALACDLRIASDRAKLTTAFAKVGLGGDFGITWPLTRLLGEAKAKELLFLSDVLTAQDAHAVGLELAGDRHIRLTDGDLRFTRAENDIILEYRLESATQSAPRTLTICGTRFHVT